jgi:hypothetical protein
MIDMLAPGRGVPWFLEFAKRNPDAVVADSGGLVHHMIERGSRDPVGVLKRAGFDAIDSGRDVRKLVGTGIRSKDAAFDPARRDDLNIFAALPFGALIAGQGLADPSRE